MVHSARTILLGTFILFSFFLLALFQPSSAFAGPAAQVGGPASCSNFGWADPACNNQRIEKISDSACDVEQLTQSCPGGSEVITCIYSRTTCDSKQSICNAPMPGNPVGDGYNCNQYCNDLAGTNNNNCWQDNQWHGTDPRPPCNQYKATCLSEGCTPSVGYGGVDYACNNWGVCIPNGSGAHTCVSQPPVVDVHDDFPGDIRVGGYVDVSWELGNNPNFCERSGSWGTQAITPPVNGTVRVPLPNPGTYTFTINCTPTTSGSSDTAVLEVPEPDPVCVPTRCDPISGSPSCTTTGQTPGRDNCNNACTANIATCPGGDPPPAAGTYSCNINRSCSGQTCTFNPVMIVTNTVNGVSTPSNVPGGQYRFRVQPDSGNGGVVSNWMGGGSGFSFTYQGGNYSGSWAETGLNDGTKNATCTAGAFTINGPTQPPPPPSNLSCWAPVGVAGQIVDIGRWRTGDPGGATPVGANFNLTLPGKVEGAGCYRPDTGGSGCNDFSCMVPGSATVGGKFWLLGPGGSIPPHWAGNPNDSQIRFGAMNLQTFAIPGNVSYWVYNTRGSTLCQLHSNIPGGPCLTQDGATGYISGADGVIGTARDDPMNLFRDKAVTLWSWPSDYVPLGFIQYQTNRSTGGPNFDCSTEGNYVNSSGNFIGTSPLYNGAFYYWGRFAPAGQAGPPNWPNAYPPLTGQPAMINGGGQSNPNAPFCMPGGGNRNNPIVNADARVDWVFDYQPKPPPAAPVPAAPTLSGSGPVCTTGSPTNTLTWNLVGGADNYTVFRNGVPISGLLPSSQNTYSDSAGTVANTSYNYYVIASNLSGNSPPSNTVTSIAPPCDSGPPVVSLVSQPKACVVPDALAARDGNGNIVAKPEDLSSAPRQTIRYTATDPSGVANVYLVILNSSGTQVGATRSMSLDPDQTTYPNAYSYIIPDTDLTSVVIPTNHYSYYAYAVDTLGNSSQGNPVLGPSFRTDKTCGCANLEAGGDVHSGGDLNVGCE